MDSREALIVAIEAEAWSWEGTPVQHQQSLKGVACDCKGLLAGVLRGLGRPEAESAEALAADYGVPIDTRRLKRGLGALFDRVDGPPERGGILLLSYYGSPQHLGICTRDRRPGRDGGLAVVHAFGIGGRRTRTVVSTPLESALQVWPLDSVWRIRDLATGEGQGSLRSHPSPPPSPTRGEGDDRRLRRKGQS